MYLYGYEKCPLRGKTAVFSALFIIISTYYLGPTRIGPAYFTFAKTAWALLDCFTLFARTAWILLVASLRSQGRSPISRLPLLSVAARSEATWQSSVFHKIVSYKSSHSLFMDSIKRNFFPLEPAFICFSRVIAASIVSRSS
jgi:hypothetical protein